LFFTKDNYSREEIFKGYSVVSQDEGHYSFEQAIAELKRVILEDNPNVFAAFGAVDSMGHQCSRGDVYDKRLKNFMDAFKEVIQIYADKYPNQEIIIASDHGMSTIKHKIHIDLEKHFGKQSKKTYIAYVDSCMMCVWCKDEQLLQRIKEYLLTRPEGHVITEEERAYYRATDKKFGDILFNLREGYCFSTSWFGKGLGEHPDGEGMHGFWPERTAKDQMATIILINGKRKLDSFYRYPDAYQLLKKVMQGQ
jgi:predicted AlkP superfamily pyrophosphatase or phosphodiesterase